MTNKNDDDDDEMANIFSMELEKGKKSCRKYTSLHTESRNYKSTYTKMSLFLMNCFLF